MRTVVPEDGFVRRDALTGSEVSKHVCGGDSGSEAG